MRLGQAKLSRGSGGNLLKELTCYESVNATAALQSHMQPVPPLKLPPQPSTLPPDSQSALPLLHLEIQAGLVLHLPQHLLCREPGGGQRRHNATTAAAAAFCAAVPNSTIMPAGRSGVAGREQRLPQLDLLFEDVCLDSRRRGGGEGKEGKEVWWGSAEAIEASMPWQKFCPDAETNAGRYVSDRPNLTGEMERSAEMMRRSN